MSKMKKCMALFLAIALIAQSGFTSSATESVDTSVGAEETVTETMDETVTGQPAADVTKDTEQPEAGPSETTDEQTPNPSETAGPTEELPAAGTEEQPGDTTIAEEPETESGDAAAPETPEVGAEEPVPAEEVLPENQIMPLSAEDGIEPLALNDLSEGVTVIDEGAEGLTFDIDEGKVVMLAGTLDDGEPIVFKDCTFNLSGETVKISGAQVKPHGGNVSYHSGETTTKLWIGDNVQFDNCTFVSENGTKISSSGNDACIYFFSGNIVLNDCTVTAADYQGQFLGLYGSTGSVTFNDSKIATTGNTGGWSYAMFAQSVLNLNGSTMTATGMKRAENGGNVNAFYSGDASTNYDAINIKDSTIDFSDNYGGGFAINRVNIYVENSNIVVNDNAGNGSNSGMWHIKDSAIQMNRNRTHGWSHISDETENSTIEVLHNGYAGYYITADSSFKNCSVDIRCNGEDYLSYSAGDVWLNGHTLTIDGCNHAWLGTVGRRGTLNVSNCPYLVANDLYENKTKGSTSQILTEDITISEQDEHVLFLNPDKDFDYARGDTEGRAGNSNDDDLFEDVTKEKVTGKDTAKIDTMTTAQLSHHIYDWENGTITDEASEDYYGVVRYECVDTCKTQIGWTENHPNSFDCDGTYVYAPLTGLAFDANAGSDTVSNLPENQTKIVYQSAGTAPKEVPVRESGTDEYKYVFVGWYTDKECTEKFDFSQPLTQNWTVVYAKWTKDYAQDKVPGGTEINRFKTATELDANDETTVKLTVGSTEDRNKVAVLFVLDYSTSVNVRDAAADMIQELAGKDKTDIKCAVVNYWADADEGAWTDIQSNTDVNALLSQTNTDGTNYHAGLVSAQKLLASSEIEGYTTYLITISDGITYLWTDETTGETLSVWYHNRGNGADDYQNANSVYDMKYYDQNEDKTFTANPIPSDMFEGLMNGSEDIVGKYEATKPYFIPYSVPKSEVGKMLDFEVDGTEENYLIGNEIALYKTATLYKELAKDVDYAYAFKLDENHWNSYPYGEQLMDYLASVSNGGEITANTAKSTFEKIKNQILYTIDQGVVTDVIGNDFDLKAIDTFKLTVGGNEISGSVDEENNRVNFGTADENGTYPYTVEYQPGEPGSEQFLWKINVPVETANRLELSYVLKLVNKSEEAGTYGTYDEDGSENYETIQTNESAVLKYETTEGDTGSVLFPKPTVSYTVKAAENPQEPQKPTDPGNGSSSGGKKHHHSSSDSSDPETPAAAQNVTSVKTGDTNNILLPVLGILLAAALLGAYGTMVYKKKKRS